METSALGTKSAHSNGSFIHATLCAGPFSPVRMAPFILSLATAAFTRRLLVHQTAGEIVDKWIEAAVGAG